MKRFLLALWFIAAFCFPAVAQLGITGVGGGFGVAASAATCTFKNTATDAANNTTRTYSIDIGTASADRLVIVAVTNQNTVFTGVSANSVGLTQATITALNGWSAGIYSGVVNTGSGAQNIVVTGAQAFSTTTVSVWTCTGLASNTAQQTAQATGGTLNISVTAGDFLFAVTRTSTSNSSFASSTQAPTATHNAAATSTSVDWITIASTNAAFSINATNGGTVNVIAGASYR